MTRRVVVMPRHAKDVLALILVLVSELGCKRATRLDVEEAEASERKVNRKANAQTYVQQMKMEVERV